MSILSPSQGCGPIFFSCSVTFALLEWRIKNLFYSSRIWVKYTAWIHINVEGRVCTHTALVLSECRPGFGSLPDQSSRSSLPIPPKCPTQWPPHPNKFFKVVHFPAKKSGSQKEFLGANIRSRAPSEIKASKFGGLYTASPVSIFCFLFCGLARRVSNLLLFPTFSNFLGICPIFSYFSTKFLVFGKKFLLFFLPLLKLPTFSDFFLPLLPPHTLGKSKKAEHGEKKIPNVEFCGLPMRRNSCSL